MNGVNGTDNNPLKTITKEEISRMEPISFPGRIVVVQSHAEAERAAAYLTAQKVIGFDTETRPAFKKGQKNKVALLQLATADYCFLFRLNIIGFPKCLIDLLVSQETVKIGLSLKDDFMTMRRLANFDPDGFIELQHFVKQFDIQEASLQKIYAILFRRKISKSQRLTNWEADVLTEGQKKYAATDAWACMRIYEALNESTNS